MNWTPLFDGHDGWMDEWMILHLIEFVTQIFQNEAFPLLSVFYSLSKLNNQGIIFDLS